MNIVFADEKRPIAAEPEKSNGAPLAGVVIDFESQTITVGRLSAETPSNLQMVLRCNEMTTAKSLNIWVKKRREELLGLFQLFRVKTIWNRKRLYYMEVGYVDEHPVASEAYNDTFLKYQQSVSNVARYSKNLWRRVLAKDFLHPTTFRTIQPDTIEHRWVKGRHSRADVPALAKKLQTVARNRNVLLCGTTEYIRALMDNSVNPAA